MTVNHGGTCVPWLCLIPGTQQCVPTIFSNGGGNRYGIRGTVRIPYETNGPNVGDNQWLIGSDWHRRRVRVTSIRLVHGDPQPFFPIRGKLP